MLCNIQCGERSNLQQTVYHHKIPDTDRLKRVLIDCLSQLNQHTLK